MPASSSLDMDRPRVSNDNSDVRILHQHAITTNTTTTTTAAAALLLSLPPPLLPWLLVYYFTPNSSAKHCNKCLPPCISQNDTSNNHKIFCICNLWLWLGPPLMTRVIWCVHPVLQTTSRLPIMPHFNVVHQMAPAVYMFTVKRLRTVLAGGKVCYPGLPCYYLKTLLSTSHHQVWTHYKCQKHNKILKSARTTSRLAQLYGDISWKEAKDRL